MRLSAWPLDTGVRNGYNVTVNKKGLGFFPFNSYVFNFFNFFSVSKSFIFNLVQDLGGPWRLKKFRLKFRWRC